jgi:hypothetical protein
MRIFDVEILKRVEEIKTNYSESSKNDSDILIVTKIR